MPKTKSNPEDPSSAFDVLKESFGEATDDPGSQEPTGEETDTQEEQLQFDDYDPGHPLYTEPEPEPEPEPETDSDPEPAEEPNVIADDAEGPPKDANDEQRYQYWQSRHDKLKAEKDAELNQYKSRLDQLEQQFQQISQPGNQQPGTPPAPSIDESIQAKTASLSELDASAPKPPAKPSSYNEADAYTDPESQSFRYKRELEDYNSKVNEYLIQRDKVKDELYDLRMKKVEEPTKNMVRQQLATKKEREIFDNLQKNYKLSADEAQDFIRVMSSPSSMSYDNLVQYYKFMKGTASPSPSQKPPKSGKPIAQPPRDAAPPPIKGAAGGKEPDTPDDNDMFSASLLRGGKTL